MSVIANVVEDVVKQSMRKDCFVATLLAMTGAS